MTAQLLLIGTPTVVVACYCFLLRRRRQLLLREEEEELRRLLAAVKALNKSNFYVVSNAKGDAFSKRGVETHCRKKGIVIGSSQPKATTLDHARALVASLEHAAGSAVAYGPPRSARLNHAIVRGIISGASLAERFEQMREAYVQQPLDYGRNSVYGDKWRISCYLVVLEKWKPRIFPHAPMVECMGPVMDECARKFETWYSRHHDLASCDASVMNCFLTRYRPTPEEDELKRHIDGASVDGSVILALPTAEAFEGGKLKVWDAKREFEYSMAPGDAIFLDTRVWHQATPITQGERWALVLFLKISKKTRSSS